VKSKDKINGQFILTVIVILLTVVVALFGLLDNHPGHSYDYINQYGDTVKIYGEGLYRNDSYFKAPIFRGSDFTMLLLAVPLLVYALHKFKTKPGIATRTGLISALAVAFYYAASIAFGVVYNQLQLVYIALFSVALFALIRVTIGLDYHKTAGNNVTAPKGVYVFLYLTGAALIVAWLPDIISSLISGRSLALIENYTTEITYVLDMGLVAPLCFVCVYLLKKGMLAGYILLDALLTLCMVVGVMLPVQTIFQLNAGIDMPLPVLITKAGTFCILALFALYFRVRLQRVLKTI
jgi:hypothetical protein